MINRYPLLLPLALLVMGILAAGFLPPRFGLLLGGACSFVVLLVAVIYFRHQSFAHVLVAMLFFLAGYLLTGLRDGRFVHNHYAHTHLNKKGSFIGSVVAYPVKTKKAVRVEVTLLGDVSGTQISGVAALYTPQDSAALALLPGDEVLFETELKALEEPKNPNEFDYRNYMHLHGIYAQGYAQHWTKLPQYNKSVTRWATKLRNKLLSYLQAMPMSTEEKAVASALLIGYRHDVPDDTSKAFGGAGAMHVLAVSGLHVGILYVVTAFLLGIDRRKPNRNPWPKVLLTIGIIWFYALLTGLSPSVSRAAVMFTFVAAGHLISRKTVTIQALLASALILLAINPNNLFEVGFQLSYAAVFGIVYLQKRLYYLINKPKIWLFDQAWQITTVSIAAQAATFPLGLYYFHQFPVLFLVSNLFVIPLATVTMYCGLFALLYSSIFPISGWVVWPLQKLLMAMIGSVRLVEGVPYSVIEGLWVNRFELVLYTLLVFAAADALWYKRKMPLLLGTLAATTLLASNIYRIYKQQHRRQITFYSVPQTPVAEARIGRESTLVAPAYFLKDEDAMLFYIRHNLWEGGVKNATELTLSTDTFYAGAALYAPMAEIGGMRILFAAQPSDLELLELRPDILYVAGNFDPPPNVKQIPHVVLMSGLREKSSIAWQRALPNIHDLTSVGALTIKQ